MNVPAPTDVLVVGAGPVGLVTSTLLARRGWRVAVLERWPDPYPRPRAVHFDDEVARLLAGAGIADRIPALTEAADIYEWRNAAGATLLRFDWSGPGRSGWPTASMVHQPALEDALSLVAASIVGLTVHRGWEAVALSVGSDTVSVTARDRAGATLPFEASWVIGCDGANSFVRDHMPTAMTDLGFFYDWLIVDVVPHEARTWDPVNLQVCDPVRPTTAVSGGPGRRRWEFMRRPDEAVEDMDSEATAWRLLAPWGMTPETCTLERHALYTFEARWADAWRSGRLLLAGDAAHLMPPFAGQGMCSGIRDAANLAWKLDLVLRGVADPALLDTYGEERSAHVQFAIAISVELGKVICVSDPDEARQRDELMTGLGGDPDRILPPLPPPTLGNGVIRRGADGTPAAGAGVLTPQGRLSRFGRTGLHDEVVDAGFVLLCTAAVAGAAGAAGPAAGAGVAGAAGAGAAGAGGSLGGGAEEGVLLSNLGVSVVPLVAAGSDADPPAAALDGVAVDGVAVDVDGTYLAWLTSLGAVAALVRPDHYLFGVADSPDDVGALIADLRRQLAAPAVAPSEGA